MLSVGENNFSAINPQCLRACRKSAELQYALGNSIELYGQATFWKDSLMCLTHQSGLPPVYGLLMACEKLI